MELRRKDLIIKLLTDLVIFGFFGLLIFSIFLSNLYIRINALNNDRIEIQDTYNMIIDNTNSEAEITYGDIPSYLYSYIDCLNNGLPKESFSITLNSKIEKLNMYLKKKNNKVQFSYKDINTGFHLGYNEHQKLFAASTTKAPLAMYTYKLVDENKLDLNKEYTYTSNYYAGGTGILKNKELNTKYSLRDITKYSIIYSDNIAYLMLLDIVSKKETTNYFKSKGAKNLFNSLNNSSLYKMFGEISASDGNVYMIELYKYSLNNTKNSKELVQFFKDASLNTIKEGTNKQVAHKYGWTDKYVHDMGLVFDENPFVISITSTMGNENWNKVFTKIAKETNNIHETYWNETKLYCKNNLK